MRIELDLNTYLNSWLTVVEIPFLQFTNYVCAWLLYPICLYLYDCLSTDCL